MRKRRENQLLIHCARIHLDAERIHHVRSLLEIGGLDWDYILEHCLFHHTPLLFCNLQQVADESNVPQSVMDTLSARYAYIFYRNMQIYGALREILERFQNRGIPVILLKGVALGGTVYSDIDLRPPGDIDLLVKKADLQNAAEVLLQMGYGMSDSMQEYKNHYHLPPFRKFDEEIDGYISVDIHHNLAREPIMSRIDADYLWENLQVVNISGIEALALSPENLILHLCIHLSKRFAERHSLSDISESIRYYGTNIDWHFVIRRSSQWKIGSFVYYPLYLAREVMDADVPAYVLNSLELHPELKPFETEFLKIILRRCFSIVWDLSFPSRLVRAICMPPSKQFLYTSRISNRLRNVGLEWIRAGRRAFFKCFK